MENILEYTADAFIKLFINHPRLFFCMLCVCKNWSSVLKKYSDYIRRETHRNICWRGEGEVEKFVLGKFKYEREVEALLCCVNPDLSIAIPHSRDEFCIDAILVRNHDSETIIIEKRKFKDYEKVGENYRWEFLCKKLKVSSEYALISGSISCGIPPDIYLKTNGCYAKIIREGPFGSTYSDDDLSEDAEDSYEVAEDEVLFL